jgi:acyl transferase domain-containing protein
LKEDIVIVGQAVRLPGDINNAESLWKAVIDQRDHWHIMTQFQKLEGITRVSTDRPDYNLKDPLATCDISLDKAVSVELAGFDHSFKLMPDSMEPVSPQAWFVVALVSE